MIFMIDVIDMNHTGEGLIEKQIFKRATPMNFNQGSIVWQKKTTLIYKGLFLIENC